MLHGLSINFVNFLVAFHEGYDRFCAESGSWQASLSATKQVESVTAAERTEIREAAQELLPRQELFEQPLGEVWRA